ncbi:MAG: cbb3-type cytochrome c oxidase subunit II [Geobacter sp.]|nr:cbb3-type cytochrome c oxidase subunit II [Geobacter sp.]
MLEKRPVILLVMAAAAIMIGTVVTVVLPFRWISAQRPAPSAQAPYNALQLEGRDIYIREGCNNCHTQTVRSVVADVLRYGEPSRAEESAFDRPFLWGSRRTGPDLARIGRKYPDQWHYAHFDNPQEFAPRSNMPSYAFLRLPLDTSLTERKMRTLGFRYTNEEIAALKGKTEMDAMVAYMQKLGIGTGKRKQ